MQHYKCKFCEKKVNGLHGMKQHTLAKHGEDALRVDDYEGRVSMRQQKERDEKEKAEKEAFKKATFMITGAELLDIESDMCGFIDMMEPYYKQNISDEHFTSQTLDAVILRSKASQ